MSTVAKRINIVSIKMIKESSFLYQTRTISSPKDAYEMIKDQLQDLDREQFIIACLNTKNEPTNISVVSVGTLNKAIVHPATTNLLNGYLNQKNLTIPIHYAGSKASAYKKFVRDGYRFSIISQDLLEADSKYQIIKTYHPDMVWCLYHIIK